jgi:hypothetical protein
LSLFIREQSRSNRALPPGFADVYGYIVCAKNWQLGGYSFVEVKDLDEAIAIAARHPLLGMGLSIEVRPIREGPPQ